MFFLIYDFPNILFLSSELRHLSKTFLYLFEDAVHLLLRAHSEHFLERLSIYMIVLVIIYMPVYPARL